MLGLAAGCGGKAPVSPSSTAREPAAPAAATPDGAPAPVPPPPGAAAVIPANVPAGASTNQAFGVNIGEIDLSTISLALQQYVAANQVEPSRLTEQDLQKLVTQKYLPRLPAPPAGKKYVWDGRLQVSLANQ